MLADFESKALSRWHPSFRWRRTAHSKSVDRATTQMIPTQIVDRRPGPCYAQSSEEKRIWKVKVAWAWMSGDHLHVIQDPPVSELCLTLCDPMDYSLPGSSVHGILQARIPEWVAITWSKGSSQPRDRTCVSQGSCVAGGLPLSHGASLMIHETCFSDCVTFGKQRILNCPQDFLNREHPNIIWEYKCTSGEGVWYNEELWNQTCGVSLTTQSFTSFAYVASFSNSLSFSVFICKNSWAIPSFQVDVTNSSDNGFKASGFPRHLPNLSSPLSHHFPLGVRDLVYIS